MYFPKKPNTGAGASRRDFLTGQAALQAATRLFDAPENEIASAYSGSSTYLIQISRNAMACEFQVLLNAAQDMAAVELAVEALDCVDVLENQLSMFREHSEVSRINRTAFSECLQVTPELFALLEQCLLIYRETGGAFDITASPFWRLWGFHRRSGHFPDPAEVEALQQTVGSRWLELHASDRSVRFQREGMEINLGAIGKGHALDICTQIFARDGVEDYLIHGGQSSILARGNRLRTDESGWLVGICHPLRPDRRIAEVRLQNRSLGTSGSANQFFYHLGRRYSHILDPRTGWPADRVLGTTVLAPTAARADALSTAFFVMGVEEVQAYCLRHPEIAAVIVVAGQRSGETDLVTVGLSAEDFRDLSE